MLRQALSYVPLARPRTRRDPSAWAGRGWPCPPPTASPQLAKWPAMSILTAVASPSSGAAAGTQLGPTAPRPHARRAPRRRAPRRALDHGLDTLSASSDVMSMSSLHR